MTTSQHLNSYIHIMKAWEYFYTNRLKSSHIDMYLSGADADKFNARRANSWNIINSLLKDQKTRQTIFCHLDLTLIERQHRQMVMPSLIFMFIYRRMDGWLVIKVCTLGILQNENQGYELTHYLQVISVLLSRHN